MKLVYISGAITGCENWIEKFNKAEEELSEKGYYAVNPAYLEKCFPKLDYECYMKIDMALLDCCDAIYMLKDWKNSKGANRELGFAMGKGIEIMYE